MRVVVDTNVLISAALRDRGPERAIMWIIGNPAVTWVASDALIAEYRDVLARPRFGLSAAQLAAWSRLIDNLARVVVDPALRPPTLERDPGDRVVLAAALAGRADIILSGDRDLLDTQPLAGVPVVRVGEFVVRFCTKS